MSIRHKIKIFLKRINAVLKNNMIKRGEHPLNFEIASLSVSHARADVEEYELLKTESGARVTYYEGFRRYKEVADREDCIKKRAEGGKELYDEICGILKSCGVVSWNGFSKGNRHVLDGSSFTFSANVNGKKIYASGENKYPRKYREFIAAIRDILDREEDNDDK